MYPPYRFKVYSRVREDPKRYSARMQSKCGCELPSSDEIYDNLLCFAFKNSVGSHPIKKKKLNTLLENNIILAVRQKRKHILILSLISTQTKKKKKIRFRQLNIINLGQSELGIFIMFGHQNLILFFPFVCVSKSDSKLKYVSAFVLLPKYIIL